MNCSENEYTPQGTRIYRGEVISQYKKYHPAILVGLQGISDGSVTTFWSDSDTSQSILAGGHYRLLLG